MSTTSQVSGVLAQGGDIPAPHIEYGQIGPLLLVLGAAVVGVLVEAFVGRRGRYWTQVPVAFLGLAGGFVWTILLAWRDDPHHVAAEGALGVDGPTLFIQGTILVLALVSTLLIAERGDGRAAGGHFAAQASALPGSEAEQRTTAAGFTQTEVFPLMMFAVGGMMMFPAANDLLTMFVALEVMSLPLYLLCGLARRRRLLSQEAAVKYFLLGAFSSAFFLYGAALLYGYAGSVRLSDISAQIGKDAGSETMLLAGVALLSVGLLFKLGGVPFHMWKPDVYQGAPTPITALMASCTVVAAFGGILRVYYVAFETLRWDWQPVMWGVAILTMVAGSIIAITQTDIKRMLAYSSVAHAGFLLMGVIASSPDGLSSTMFYLVAYGFTSVGAFAVVTMVRDAGGEAGHLSRWAGLGKRSPVVAGVFAFFLLAFAGIPLTSGFTGKFAVFKAAVEGDATPLVIVAVVSSAVAAFFYVRVIVVMFFSEPDAEGPVVVAGPATAVAVALGVTATVVLGVIPQPVLDLAGTATTHMFVR
ncbi:MULTISPECIES: NADH-quinone oxidoreductase subunit NuoN [Actinomadura]|uniref:NADH-quinone oxidoreductase subunit N n=1 Tax=Actinomadura madurae TaxID=1993 RepID=A0A1I5EG63_9ACTN|nr:NADH-quinone oxidoreductase subunit NuoN [Actinomadura madurae]MCP9952867.1 NADH-quinone oxidoreductase subunit NuoN [Actinomadura madurae]MCP9969631.1 NADH-quinone oxidoreductase subunit NuoN [Actinomadura madurae]URM98359.1 NADH-quinone oxidoreductase subunit NuoN [Actinomadura madurae]SFO10353.1 NADH dehydrogenase subunit N [Actinomadura madurae]SPT59922.1 NADH-quinone oxidoreductase subunit N [Actinomadura madurae]